MADCADTSAVDTLFVTFRVPQATPGLESLGVVVYFHPLGGDSLGPFWHFKSGWENQSNMLIDFEVYPGGDAELPWNVHGNGVVSYDHRSGRGRLDMGFALPKGTVGLRGFGIGLRPGTTYSAARIRIRHRRSDLAGCAQPVCVEASELVLKFATGRRMRSGPGDERFASWRSPEGAACVSRAATKTPRAWRPR